MSLEITANVGERLLNRVLTSETSAFQFAKKHDLNYDNLIKVMHSGKHLNVYTLCQYAQALGISVSEAITKPEIKINEKS